MAQTNASTPIGTPVRIIPKTENWPSNQHIATNVDAPKGSLIVVMVGAWASTNGTATAVTDSAGNTYTLAVQVPATSGVPYPAAIFYSSNTSNDLPSGGWINVTNSGANAVIVWAGYVTGANGGLDATAQVGSTATTSVTLSTGALNSSNEIVFGGLSTTQNFTFQTCASGFTELWNNTNSCGGPFDNGLGWAYDIVKSKTSITYHPSFNIVNAGAVLASFMATPGKATMAQANTAALASGLVGYWTLDGNQTNWATGQTYDASGQGNTGQLISMNTTTSPVIGKIGGAMQFNGATPQYVSISDSSSVQVIGSGSVTVWFYPTSATFTGSHTLVAKGYGNGDQMNYGMYVFNGTKLYVEIDDSTGGNGHYNQTFVLTSGISLNKWHHLVMTWNGSNLREYLDGVQVSNTAQTLTPGAYSGIALTIGTDTLGGVTPWKWRGSLDDVRVYNRALSAQEIQQLYALGAAKMAQANTTSLASGLVGYWTLDGNQTNWATGQTYDASGQGNTGQLISMSTTTSSVIGKIGQALSFFNSTSRVKLSSDPVGTSAATLCAWLYPIHNSGQANIFSNTKFQVLRGLSGQIYGSSDNVTFPTSPNNVAPLNKWTHTCVTRDASGTWNFYINGAHSGTANQSSGTPTAGNNSQTYIGQSQGLGASFLGYLDDVRIYNRALSAQEIQQLYKMGAQ
jgi:hypothetical protein